jgi:hypothetical protein
MQKFLIQTILAVRVSNWTRAQKTNKGKDQLPITKGSRFKKAKLDNLHLEEKCNPGKTSID